MLKKYLHVKKKARPVQGEGIAIPHGKWDAVKAPGLAAMVVRGGVDFDSLDDEKVTLIFLIAAPTQRIMYILMYSVNYR